MFDEDKSKRLKKTGRGIYVRTAATTRLSVKKAEGNVLNKGIHEMLHLHSFCKQNNLRFVTKICFLIFASLKRSLAGRLAHLQRNDSRCQEKIRHRI